MVGVKLTSLFHEEFSIAMYILNIYLKLLSFVAFFSLKDWRFICWLLFKARFRALTKYFDCLENPTFSSATLGSSEESVRFVPNMHQIRLYCFSSSQSWKDCFIWNSVRGRAEKEPRISVPVPAVPVSELLAGKNRKICKSLNWF